MTDIAISREGISFGRTTVVAAVGELVDQQVEALVYPANSRGIMGAAGGSGGGAIRLLGGPDIEREAMALAPLELGTAVVTGAGRLTERGVFAVIHAVVAPALGAPAKTETVRRAIGAAARAADAQRLRSLAIPPLGVAAGGPQSRTTLSEAAVDELVAYLRRSSSRIERVIFVFRFEDEVQRVAATIARARERTWIRQPWTT